jgi:hypothetical protein
MIQRIAASMSLIAFAVCLLVGGLDAENPFATTVWRALQAMFATFVVGWIVGIMAQAMLDENLKAEREKLKNKQPKPAGNDR